MSCFTCCTGEIDYNLDDLNQTTQILPKKYIGLSHTKNNTTNLTSSRNKTSNNTNNLFPIENFLLSFGDISYPSTVDLNSLISKDKTLINVKSLCFGDSHSLMLLTIPPSNKTFLFGYGSNQNGQLGLEFKSNEQNTYETWTHIPLESEEKTGLFFFQKNDFEISDIAVGDGFSIVTVQYNRDKSYGLYRFQLTRQDRFEVYQDKETSSKKKKTIYKEPFDQSNNGGIKKVSVFNDRILILTHDNSLYVKGLLFNLNLMNNYTLYKKFDFEILDIYQGINHCLLLGEHNLLYGMGNNEYGELGILDEHLEEGEICLNDFFSENDLNIVKIVNGARHSLVLCDNGNIYCFGDNSDGQCCGLEKVVLEPTLVKFFDDDDEEENVFVVDICCGFNHSICKDSYGKVYFWGDSAWGKLGIKETKVDQCIPLEMSDMKIRNVVKMFAGPMQSAIFVSGGIMI